MTTRLTPRLLLLLTGAAIVGTVAGAWMSERMAMVNLAEALQQNLNKAQATTAYQPQSEAGAFLIAQYAEHDSDWQMTHNALMFLEKNVGLPETQNARLFLAAIAAGDWSTAREMQREHPEAITGSAPSARSPCSRSGSIFDGSSPCVTRMCRRMFSSCGNSRWQAVR